MELFLLCRRKHSVVLYLLDFSHVFPLFVVFLGRLLSAYIELGRGLKILSWPHEICKGSEQTKPGIILGGLGLPPTWPLLDIYYR
jgi:hypothetical protein